MLKILKITPIFLLLGWAGQEFLRPQEMVIEVAQSQNALPSESPLAGFSILDKIVEDNELLRTIPLKVGDKDIAYVENRFTRDGEKISIKRKDLAEPEKEIALELLNLENGQTEVIKITKRGAELITPENYQIEAVERSSGIRWNKWNTHFRVIEPANTIVIKNKYPEIEYKTVKQRVKNKSGKWQTISVKQRTIREIIYTPYSDGLHLQEIVAGGGQYIKNIVAKAREELTQKRVPSRTIPGKLVTEVSALPASFFERLPLLEQSDLSEFLLDRPKTIERVQVLLAANLGTAFANTCSSASACGWVQFTPTTYKNISKAYPRAKLHADFEKGAADHLNSMMAAILLYDYNLQGFISRHGEKILRDPQLEEYLAAAYNGRPTTASTSLKAAISKKLPDWTGKLKLETKGFMTKLRFLIINDLP